MILDADDVIMPGCLCRAAAIMSADQTIAFAYGKGIQTASPAAVIAMQDGKPQSDNWHVYRGLEFIDKVCRTGNCIVSPPTVVRRTNFQKAIGYYPLELQRAIDLNMWLRLATAGSVAETTAIQGIHRRHPNQLSAFYRDNLICDFVELFNNFEHFFMNEGGGIPCSLAKRHATAKKIASNAFVAAVKRLLRGRVTESGQLFELAYSTWRKSRSYRTDTTSSRRTKMINLGHPHQIRRNSFSGNHRRLAPIIVILALCWAQATDAAATSVRYIGVNIAGGEFAAGTLPGTTAATTLILTPDRSPTSRPRE